MAAKPEETDVSNSGDITSRKNSKDSTKATVKTSAKDAQLWRDLTAYWWLGLCNNYGYVVMLSAAHDIIARFSPGDHTGGLEPSEDTGRYCNIISTGAILLADVIPGIIAKAIVPFLPFYIHIRVLTAILLQCAGFLLVAFADREWMAILGVILTSASSGLGEASFLAYSEQFNKNVISTWSSGTGGAGITGSLSYAGLISLGVTPVTTILLMLVVPGIEAFAFWVILRRPKEGSMLLTEEGSSNNTVNNLDTNSTKDTASTNEKDVELHNEGNEDEQPLIGLKAKFLYIPKLFKYMIPLTMVYFLEYLINQGLFELVYFPNIWLDHSSQYRWLQVDYQIGVFISRSSVNIVTIEKIWLMAVFQFFNVIIFLFEVIYFFMPSIWVVFAVVFWEGLLGGGAYVNTFYRMSKEVPKSRRNFALGVVPVGDSLGIAIAGAVAIPVHNALCMLPIPK